MDQEKAPIIAVIHTTADFDYVNTLCFSENAVQIALEALKCGAEIVTDTKMAMAGINKSVLEKLGGRVQCFVSDEDVSKRAKEENVTRSSISVRKRWKRFKANHLCRRQCADCTAGIGQVNQNGEVKPAFVIGVPVGFVHVCESKEIIMKSGVPYIVAKGRKGGANGRRQSLMRFCIWLARESNKTKRCTAFRAMHLFIYSFFALYLRFVFFTNLNRRKRTSTEIAAIPNLFRIESIALSAFWARSFCLLGKKEICSASSFVTLVREIPNRRKGVRFVPELCKKLFCSTEYFRGNVCRFRELYLV